MSSVRDPRERFVRKRLALPTRFGRPDIESWLNREGVAETPSCHHDVRDLDPTCVWCRITQQDILQITDVKATKTILERCATPMRNPARIPRLVSLKDPFDFLSHEGEYLNEFWIGRDRYVVFSVPEWKRGTLPRSQCNLRAARYWDEPTDVNGQTVSTCFFESNGPNASCAIADVLLAEWQQRGPNADLARAFLVESVRLQVRAERRRALEHFDPECPDFDDAAAS